ncbi:carbohydrate-binding family 9-like protein [Pedobacter sp. MC2016-15]|uniref:carbohydrate-binding family 9-like protein n=1 Tax=Pedobacter sp. MC2016-15 TaxID=2994473 RepID=UPI002246E91D|nr:carbohydrate-binding family 9-like protein [Pedobacter sp. MC2016-15]MCX2479724.1 carbohydrate-binding family 9-like protein [Pedobacter sp. MC2016-15]
MKLAIPYLHSAHDIGLPELQSILDQLPAVPLSNTSWPKFNSACKAEMIIAHSKKDIFLKFNVSNDYFRTAERKINGEVHRDNCVEFFIAFDRSGYYYNIEFNCLGIGKMAYGSEKGDRTLADEATVQQIQTLTIQDMEGEHFNWEMTWLVPAEVFIHQEISTFEGLQASGNFYKCGDDLPEPHFLTWNRIDAPAPDFHRPDCFGEIHFLAEADTINLVP